MWPSPTDMDCCILVANHRIIAMYVDCYYIQSYSFESLICTSDKATLESLSCGYTHCCTSDRPTVHTFAVYDIS